MILDTRLTIELVPKTAWYTNVRSHVAKDEWDRLRKITYRRANYHCEICGGRGEKWPVEAHERWLYDDDTHLQKLIDLMALCPACHEVKHIGLAQAHRRGDEALVHLAKVNGWGLATARVYVDYCFEVWAERSIYEWVLDASCLKQYGISSLAAPHTDV